MTVKELLSLCPWSEDHLLGLLQSLSEKNALEWLEEAVISSSDNPILQQLNSDERDPDLANLDREFRREVLLKTQNLDGRNPYEVLDVTKSATTHEIKTKYLSLSKKFHPDRFFRKKLGHYKEKLDVIFSKIQKSYECLKDPHQREVIDRMLSIQSSPKVKTKEQALKSVRALNPHHEKLAKAEKAYHDGMAQQRQQDFISAYNSFTLASQLNPERDLYRKAMEDIRPLLNRQKAQIKANEARGANEMRLPEEMFRAAEEALKLAPDLAEAQLFWAKGVIELKKDELYRMAKERLIRAKAALPKNPEPCYLLGHILLLLGERKSAKREFQETLKRDSFHSGAKRQIEEL